MSLPLPPGWAAAPIGELCAKRVDQAPPGDAPVPYIDISAIDRATKQIGKTRFVTAADAPTRARQWVETDDVLVSMTRPNLNAVAKVGAHLDGAVASTGFDVLRVEGVHPGWIFYRVRTNEFIDDVCQDLQGVVYPAIRPPDVRGHIVPVPPLPEQSRLVEAIESYLTRLDEAGATLERVQRNLKRYRASVLKAAVEGRLVPTEAEIARAEGREYEPASVLLERILAERRRRWEEAELAKMKAKGKAPKDNKWKAKYVEPVAPDTSELPELPEGWCWAKLSHVFASVADGDHQAPPQSESGIPFVVIGNVRTGRVDLTETRFVPRHYFESLDERRRPRSGDLLYTVTGSFGIPVRVTEDRPFCVQRHIAILRPSGQSNADFLFYLLQSQWVWRQAIDSATGTAQKTVGLESLREFVLPFAPAAEQTRIVTALESLFSVADACAGGAESSQQRSARLKQSILKWAFEGRLVDQDPTDEPASVLLERIRAERDAVAAKPQRRTRQTRKAAPKK